MNFQSCKISIWLCQATKPKIQSKVGDKCSGNSFFYFNFHSISLIIEFIKRQVVTCNQRWLTFSITSLIFLSSFVYQTDDHNFFLFPSNTTIVEREWKPIYYFVASFILNTEHCFDNCDNNEMGKKKKKMNESNGWNCYYYSYHVAISNVYFFFSHEANRMLRGPKRCNKAPF